MGGEGEKIALPEEAGTLDVGGTPIAYRFRPGPARSRGAPTVVFLCGFRSSMTGNKAEHVAGWCGRNGLPCLRFDYFGHGLSGGAPADGTIGRWRRDALGVIDRFAPGKLILVGSSMGAWIAVLVALARPEKAAGLLGIAAAPDFTEEPMRARLGEAGWRRLMDEGRIERPSAYSEEPDIITRAMVEEARGNLVLGGEIGLTAPLRLMHGLADPDVPWRQSLRLLENWRGSDGELLLIKDGDHRLSRPQDLEMLSGMLSGLAERL